jgi:hypothetical protein
MISPVRAVDFDLLFDLDDWLNRERKLLRASLQLLGHHSPIELPVTLSVDATHGQAFRLNSFFLGSIIAFVKQFEEISLLVATRRGAKPRHSALCRSAPAQLREYISVASRCRATRA